MKTYFEDTEYFNTKTTAPSEERKKVEKHIPINLTFDDPYYTNRKSSKRIVGYIEKQD